MSREDGADATLVRLVSTALELRASGIEPRLDQLCAERPELTPAVAEAIELAARLAEAGRPIVGDTALRGRLLAGRYRIEAPLGAGSMGVVHRATDLELDRPVAVKVLHADLPAGDDAEQRFARESQALAAVCHRSVVTVHDRGRTGDGEPWFVMELVDGAPLHVVIEAAVDAAASGGIAALDRRDWLLRLGIDVGAEPRLRYWRTVVGWVVDLAAGLQAAHEAGVLHRDVKPSNVLIRRDGAPVLVDFGIAARVTEVAAGDGTRTLGTAAYLAPELVERGEPTVRVDVYGLAATLYHLLTLRMPYEGSPTQILARLQRHDPVPARSIRPDLPRDLTAILERGMARRPADRYPTAAAFADDLTAFLDHRPVVARPTRCHTRLWRRARRSPAVRGGAVVAAVAALVAGVVTWRAEVQAQQRAQWLETWARLPPALTLWSHRVLEGERHRVAADLLDRAAADSVDAVPTRSVRAAFRLDHGDLAGAAEDMAAVAAELATPLATELARRYRAATAGAPIAIDGLPAPAGESDRYLLACHQVRVGDVAGANATVAVPATLPALCELRLALRIGSVRGRDTWSEGIDLARSIHDEAVRLEARIGRRTATTAHLIAGALLCQGRYAEARPLIVDGIALSTPAFHGLHSNLAIVERRAGRLVDAIEQCRAALAIDPRSAAAHDTLVMALLDAMDLAGARAALDVARVGHDVRAGLEARIGYLEALAAWRRDDRDTARRLAGRALALADLAPERREARHELAFCSALVEGRDVFTAVLGAACQDTDDPWILRTLVLPELPEELDPEQTAQLRRFLEALCDDPDRDPR